MTSEQKVKSNATIPSKTLKAPTKRRIKIQKIKIIPTELSLSEAIIETQY